MEKHGEMVVGYSRCDKCGRRAVFVSGSPEKTKAVCEYCGAEKRASAEIPLKGSSVALTGKHKG
jgi:predicted nucleic acid-binding Zn ribbon protein